MAKAKHTLELLPCPFCGQPGKIYGQNVVGCEDWRCGANIDFGHWCGEENGVPAVHYVIEQWNTRVPDAERARLREQNVALIVALETAREYVHSVHAMIAGAMGHQETVVKPDLDKIDAALAAAKVKPMDERKE